MLAHKLYITIEDPKHVVLSNLPFRPGQRVEVVLIAEEGETARAARLAEFKALFQTTQALPQAQTISEADIAAEIAAYRAGQ